MSDWDGFPKGMIVCCKKAEVFARIIGSLEFDGGMTDVVTGEEFDSVPVQEAEFLGEAAKAGATVVLFTSARPATPEEIEALNV